MCGSRAAPRESRAADMENFIIARDALHAVLCISRVSIFERVLYVCVEYPIGICRVACLA